MLHTLATLSLLSTDRGMGELRVIRHVTEKGNIPLLFRNFISDVQFVI